MKFSSAIALAACVTSSYAFSTHRTTSLVHTRLSLNSLPMQKLTMSSDVSKSTTSLQMATAAASGKEEKKSLIDVVWNENTKLSIYLAVWYIGNIACKKICSNFKPFNFVI